MMIVTPIWMRDTSHFATQLHQAPNFLCRPNSAQRNQKKKGFSTCKMLRTQFCTLNPKFFDGCQKKTWGCIPISLGSPLTKGDAYPSLYWYPIMSQSLFHWYPNNIPNISPIFKHDTLRQFNSYVKWSIHIIHVRFTYIYSKWWFSVPAISYKWLCSIPYMVIYLYWPFK